MHALIVPSPGRSEYDFYLFNTKSEGGNVTVTTFVSPSLNGLGDGRPLGIALQIDGGSPQTSHYVPATASGQTAPAPWGSVDGWVANSIISVPMVFPVQPGAHTLQAGFHSQYTFETETDLLVSRFG